MKQQQDPKILQNLNKEQREAVLCNDNNLLIIAGAGSGKTKTLTHKIAYVINEGYAKPYEILALTFTNKAATEMKERIATMVGEDAKNMFIGTFHSISLRFLRSEGYKPVIYDTKDQEVLIKAILKGLNLDVKKYPPKKILSKISRYKLNMKKFDEISTATPYEALMQKIYKLYEQKLDELNAVDFDNIIIKNIEMLRDNLSVRQKYSQRFKYIFIDEYQDTNYPQYMLIKLLSSGKNKICAVGDEDQSIYSFRGADVGNIMKFNSEYDSCKVIKLEQNYRSAQKILDLANSVISKNNFRNKKRLYSEKDGGDINIIPFSSDYDEAKFIASKIGQMYREKGDISDVAVLYRTNFQSRIIEENLVKQSVPYKIVGSKKFFDRKEIKDIIAYMRLIFNKNDDVSFLRAVGSHPVGIGKKLIEKIQEFAASKSLSYFESVKTMLNNNILTDRQAGSLSEFVGIFNGLSKDEDVDKLIDLILSKSGYMKYLEKLREPGKIENVMELKSVSSTNKLEDFLEKVSLFDYSNKLDDTDSAVKLMTIHASKGLEFNTVFIPGLEEGLFPNANLKESEMDIEEERRLFYVAITRAKENLFVTYAASRRKNNANVPTVASRFLKDISLKKLENSSKEDIRRGAKVKHSVYGEGVVLAKVENELSIMLTINFYKHGIKKLLSKDRNLQFI